MHPGRISLWTDFIRQHKKGILLGILTALAGSFITVLLPLSLGNLQAINNGEEGTKSRLLLMLGLRADDLEGFFVLFFTLVILRFAFAFTEHYFSSRTASAWAKKLRDYLFERQLMQSAVQFRKKDAGYYLLRFSSDMNTARNLLSKGLIKASADAGLLIFALLVFGLMNTRLLLTVIVMLVASAPIAILLSKISAGGKSISGDEKSALLKIVSEAYGRFITIKSLNLEKRSIRSFRKKSEDVFIGESKNAGIESIERSFSETYFFLIIAAVVFTFYGRSKHGISHTELLTVVLLLLYIRGPIRRLLTLPKTWKNGMLSLDKIQRIAEDPIESSGRKTDAKKESHSVSYYSNGTYWEDRKTPDFTAENGKTTLITGPQGSGKSRILEKLICLHPLEGNEAIYLDDIRYDQLSPFEIRRQIAYSSEEIILKGNSIIDALNIRDTKDVEEKAVRILKKLGFETREGELAQGLNEKRRVPETLSSGQIQILRIARCLLTGKKVLCLDEPFVKLDFEHVRLLVNHLNECRGTHTIILTSTEIPTELMIDKKVIID